MNVVQDYYTTVMRMQYVQTSPEALNAIVGLVLKGMELNVLSFPYPRSHYQVSVV